MRFTIDTRTFEIGPRHEVSSCCFVFAVDGSVECVSFAHKGKACILSRDEPTEGLLPIGVREVVDAD